jgi:hypothetical protein
MCGYLITTSLLARIPLLGVKIRNFLVEVEVGTLYVYCSIVYLPITF